MTAACRVRRLALLDHDVRAVLSGEKTQHWTPVDPQPDEDGLARVIRPTPEPFWRDTSMRVYRCPLGLPGDRIQVLEAWRTMERESDLVDGIEFRADGSFAPIANTRAAADAWVDAHDNGVYGEQWRDPAQMPAWVPRITPEIVSVRIERVRSISDEDAVAAGVVDWRESLGGLEAIERRFGPAAVGGMMASPFECFAYMWDERHDRRFPFSANPWAWVVTWKAVH